MIRTILNIAKGRKKTLNERITYEQLESLLRQLDEPSTTAFYAMYEINLGEFFWRCSDYPLVDGYIGRDQWSIRHSLSWFQPNELQTFKGRHQVFAGSSVEKHYVDVSRVYKPRAGSFKYQRATLKFICNPAEQQEAG